MSKPAMKPKTGKTLTKLVSLRRQQAEQDFARARQALIAAEEELARMETQLRTPPAASEDFAAVALSEQNGNTQRLLKRIEAQKQLIAEMQTALADRRDALKKAFGSERRLGEIIRQK